MQFHDYPYLQLIEHILSTGVRKHTRTGIDTYSVWGHQLRFDVSDDTIPLLTTKRVHTKSIIHELLWMISGNTNVRYLQDNGVSIWNEWTNESGDLGPIYGAQWRAWPIYTQQGYDTKLYRHENNVDQLQHVIDKIKTDPNDRRLIVSAWNVADLPYMALPPCHYSYQFNVTQGKLSLLVNMRSCDVGLGLPFNLVQYALLLRMVARITGLQPGELVWSGADVHIYVNHIDALKLQLTRAPRPSPTLLLKQRDIDSIDDFEYDDFEFVNYDPDPTIKMDVAV